jgi:hypothetical protein
MPTTDKLRVTVDTEGGDIEILDELDGSGLFDSKREISLSGLRLLSALYRTQRAGGNARLIADGGKTCSASEEINGLWGQTIHFSRPCASTKQTPIFSSPSSTKQSRMCEVLAIGGEFFREAFFT